MWGGRTLPALVYIAGLFEAIHTCSFIYRTYTYTARARIRTLCKSLGSYTLQLLPKAVVLHLEH